MKKQAAEISLVDAAFLLGTKYHRTLDMVLSGKLAGRKNVGGRWVVSTESVNALKREMDNHKNGRGS